MKNKLLIITLLSLLLAGCRTVKQTSTVDSYKSQKSEQLSSRYEGLYIAVIDSLRRVAAPVENSSSYGRRQSYLRTSLAWSSAVIDSCGQLQHAIGNHDSITTKIVYKWRDRVVRDSVYINKTDTMVVNKDVRVVQGQSSWAAFERWCGRISLIVLVLIGIYLFIKWKLKF